MADEKEEKTWIGKNLMLIVVILATVLIVALISYQGPNSIPNENTSTGSNINATAESNVTGKDKIFMSWFNSSYILGYDDINCITKAAKKKNFTDTEQCGKWLKENSNRSLQQIDTYNVSSSLQAALDEYKKSLEDYNLGGINLEIGARDKNATQMNIATKYIRNGTARVERAMIMIGAIRGDIYENNRTSYGNSSSSVEYTPRGTGFN